jgi:hypothetical protein
MVISITAKLYVILPVIGLRENPLTGKASFLKPNNILLLETFHPFVVPTFTIFKMPRNRFLQLIDTNINQNIFRWSKMSTGTTPAGLPLILV